MSNATVLLRKFQEGRTNLVGAKSGIKTGWYERSAREIQDDSNNQQDNLRELCSAKVKAVYANLNISWQTLLLDSQRASVRHLLCIGPILLVFVEKNFGGDHRPEELRKSAYLTYSSFKACNFLNLVSKIGIRDSQKTSIVCRHPLNFLVANRACQAEVLFLS